MSTELERKTCSLTCVKEHKNLFDCDGVRATRYIPVASFTDTDLLRGTNSILFPLSLDISFLENLNRVCETSKSEAKKEKRDLPLRLSLLQTAAKVFYLES